MLPGRKARFGNLAAMGGAAASFATWNPGDKSASLVLSGGNLVATSPAVGAVGVRGTSSRSAGTFKYEVVLGTVGVFAPRVGFSIAGGSFGLNASGTSGDLTDGEVCTNGGSIGIVGVALTGGNTYSLEADITTREWWIQRSGASRLGPFALPPTGAIFPTIFMSAESSQVQSITANFGASAWVVPATSGFVGWPST